MTSARTRRAGLVVLALGAWAAPALADQASEALVQGFITRIDQSAAWSAKATSIASDGLSTVIGGLEIAREDGSINLVVGEIRLDELAAREGGGITALTVKVNDLSLSGGSLTATMPGATVDMLAAPDLSQWTFDPARPFTSLAQLYTRAAETEFALLAIPSYTTRQTVSKGSQKTEITTAATDIRYERMKNGVIAMGSFGRSDVSSNISGAQSRRFGYIVSGQVIRRFDFDALARVLDPALYVDGRGDRRWRTAIEGMEIGSIRFIVNGTHFGLVDGIKAGPISVRQAETPFVPALDDLIASAGSNRPYDQRVWPLIEPHLSDMVGWFRFDSISLGKMKVSSLASGGAGLDRAIIEDISADGMKRFALEGLNIMAPDVQVKLRRFELADVAWPSLAAYVAMARLQSATSRGKAPNTALASQVAASFFDLYPRIGRFVLEGVEAALSGSVLLTLDSYEAHVSGSLAGPDPLELSGALKSLVIPGRLQRATPESAAVFDALGYGDLKIAGTGRSRFDAQSGAYRIDSSLGVTDAGTLMLDYALGGLTLDRLKMITFMSLAAPNSQPDPGLMMAALGPVSIDRFTLRFEDASLVRRVLAYAAKLQGVDEATLIGNATAMLQLGLSAIKAPAFTARAVDAVGAFLRQPRSITLSLEPRQPVKVRQLMALDPANLGAAIDLLGLDVRAND